MLSDVISNYRKKNEMSLAELARRSGHPVSTIQNIDNGRNKNPAFKTICDIADVLEIPIEDLKESIKPHDKLS